jgi:tetratricopeptide (TPR) repeat protein
VRRPQYLAIAISVLLVISLYAATRQQFFGERKVKKAQVQEPSSSGTLSTDSILFYSRQNLLPGQAARLNQLENSISRGDVADQKLHLFHQLAKFWSDSARIFAPYAWYTAEAARLENSEKSLTFAAHLFLDNLMYEENPRLKQWEASQAKDLFERSLKINPGNDSSKVGLGAAVIYGGTEMPMAGINMIREVVARDSSNIYAQMTLGKASLLSGQLDKAIERFNTVVRLAPANVEAVLLMADTYERSGNRAAAIEWYRKSLPMVSNPEYRKEVENRINELKK